MQHIQYCDIPTIIQEQLLPYMTNAGPMATLSLGIWALLSEERAARLSAWIYPASVGCDACIFSKNLAMKMNELFKNTGTSIQKSLAILFSTCRRLVRQKVIDYSGPHGPPRLHLSLLLVDLASSNGNLISAAGQGSLTLQYWAVLHIKVFQVHNIVRHPDKQNPKRDPNVE